MRDLILAAVLIVLVVAYFVGLVASIVLAIANFGTVQGVSYGVLAIFLILVGKWLG